MKRIYTLFFLGLFSVAAIQAQVTMTLDPCPISATGNIWDSAQKAKGDLTNLINDGYEVAWERTFVDIPDGWTTSVCDLNQCYAPFSDEPLGPGDVLIPFFLPASATVSGESFYVQFSPNSNPGVGTVRLLVYEVADPTNSILCEYRFEVVTTGTETAKGELIAINPNPVSDRIRVQAPASQAVQIVEIYSLVGKLAMQIDLGSEQTSFDLDVTNLREGMYFARMLDANMQLVGSKRFSKVQ